MYNRVPVWYSEKVQHTVEVDLFTDSKLILRPYEIIKQKFEINSASESSAFYFEIRKAEGQISADDVADTDKPMIFHCPWKTVAVLRIRCGADVVGAAFSEIFSAYSFVACLSVFAVKRAAFIAQ